MYTIVYPPKQGYIDTNNPQYQQIMVEQCKQMEQLWNNLIAMNNNIDLNDFSDQSRQIFMKLIVKNRLIIINNTYYFKLMRQFGPYGKQVINYIKQMKKLQQQIINNNGNIQQLHTSIHNNYQKLQQVLESWHVYQCIIKQKQLIQAFYVHKNMKNFYRLLNRLHHDQDELAVIRDSKSSSQLAQTALRRFSGIANYAASTCTMSISNVQ